MSTRDFPKYQIKLSFQINGTISDKDILDTVVRHIDGLNLEEISISDIQEVFTTSNIESYLDSSGVLRGSFIFYVPDSLSIAALIAASVESLTKVKTLHAKFTLLGIDKVTNKILPNDHVDPVESKIRESAGKIEEEFRSKQSEHDKEKASLGPTLHKVRFQVARFIKLLLEVTRFDKPRLPLFIALILLTIVPFVLIQEKDLANEIMAYVYYLLLIGIGWSFVIYLIKKRANAETSAASISRQNAASD